MRQVALKREGISILRATVAAYFAAFIAFCGLDFVWLSYAGEAIYRRAIGDLLRPGFDLAPAAAFYLIYVGGLVVLVIRQAITPGQALIHGAVYGFCAYATYDLTNQATLRAWPLSLSLTDMAWGAFASAIAATCGFLAYRAL